MNKAKKSEIRKKLVSLAVEHKQDLNSPFIRQLVNEAEAFINQYTNAGLAIEIEGATIVDGYFAFVFFVPETTRH
jgi:hypothetical protein